MSFRLFVYVLQTVCLISFLDYYHDVKSDVI